MASLFADATFWVGLGLLVFLGVVAYMGAFKAFAAMLDARAAAIKAELESLRKSAYVDVTWVDQSGARVSQVRRYPLGSRIELLRTPVTVDQRK